MVRLHGLTQKELAVIGDPRALALAVNAEVTAFAQQIRADGLAMYTDEDMHRIVTERLAALPEHGPERTAIQKTYELLMSIIDGGVADARSDHELMGWINGDGTEWCPGLRPGLD
jgi:hypothetical protein